MSYSIGIDYGTASGRVFLINTTNGQVVSKFVKPYTHGVIESELNGLKIPHTYALQNSNDYLEIMEEGISYIVRESKIRSSQYSRYWYRLYFIYYYFY